MKKFLILLLFLTCCTENSITKDAIVLRIDEVKNDEPLYLSEIFDDFEVIPLEVNDSIQFGKIDDLIITENHIFLFDRQYFKGVLIFERDGKYKACIKAMGRGPGEYTRVPDFDIRPNNDEIIIKDWGIGKLCIYDVNGNHKKDIKLGDRYSDVTYNEPYYYLCNTLKQGIPLSIADEEGRVIKVLLEDNEVYRINTLHLRSMGSFFKKNSTTYLSFPHDPCIYKIEGQSVTKHIEIDSELFKYTESRELIDEISALDLPKYSSISRYSENDDLAFFRISSLRQDYYTLHSFITHETICTSKIVDDLTYTKPRLLQFNGSKFVAYLDAYQIFELKDNISSEIEKIPESLRKEIQKQSLDHSYPLIILFNVKK